MERISVKSVIIIGAGLGGLAAALRLRHMGFDVTVIEKQKRPGGRSNVLQEHGFRVDIGPTILVMKQTFDETYRAIGQDLNQRVKFVPLDPNYRVYYHDGTYIDLFNSMAKLAAECERIEPGVTTRLFRFIGEGAKKYELGMDFVARNYDHITDLANPTAAAASDRDRLATRSCTPRPASFFKTDKLRKAFTFHSMFLGLSPFDALAMYSLITYADLVEGMQYPMGGIYSIVEDMVALAGEMGVTLRTGTPVEEILIDGGRAKGVRLAGGEIVLRRHRGVERGPGLHLQAVGSGAISAGLHRRETRQDGLCLFGLPALPGGGQGLPADAASGALLLGGLSGQPGRHLPHEDAAGRSLLPHEQPDDHRSQPGAAGPQRDLHAGADAESAGQRGLGRGRAARAREAAAGAGAAG